MSAVRLRILIFLISVVCLSTAGFAQENQDVIGITDFLLHKVTPEKTTNLPEAPGQEGSSDQQTELKQDLPKLRYEQPQEKTLVQQPEVKQEQPFAAKEKEKQESAAVKQEGEAVEKPTEVKKELPAKTEEETEAKPEKALPSEESNDKVSKLNKILESDSTLPIEGKFPSEEQKKDNIYFKTFSSLLVVLFLILIAAWLYARLRGINPAAILTGNFSEKDLNNFNVITSSTLGHGKDIHLVEINGKQLVIGSTASNINLLTEISPEEIEKLKSGKQKTKTSLYEQDENEFRDILEDEIYCEPVDDLEDIKDIKEEVEDIFENTDYYDMTHSDVYKQYIKDKEDQQKEE